MKRVVAAAVIVVVLGAFMAGYWPQRRQVTVLETEVSTLRDHVADLEARNRAAALLGELLNLMDAVTRKDYGQAQQLSSTFFDRVRAESGTTLSSFRPGLLSVLGSRDAITSALARGDQQVSEQLQAIQLKLRVTLGYATVATPAQ
jgi:hypothetical protein